VEIEAWDTGAGKAQLHINVPVVSHSSLTLLYLYFDASQPDNTAYVDDTGGAAAQKVWDAGFWGVWHMAQDPSGGTGAIKDSTVNGHNGTGYDLSSANLVMGRVGKGISFPNNDSTINVGGTPVAGGGDRTLEAYYLPYAYGKLVGWGSNTYGGQSWLYHNASDLFFWGYGGGYDLQGPTAVALGQWHYGVAYQVSGSRYLWLDGALIAGPLAKSWNTGSDTPLAIGSLTANGVIDEVRVSTIARSPAWLKATYYSLTGGLASMGQ